MNGGGKEGEGMGERGKRGGVSESCLCREVDREEGEERVEKGWRGLTRSHAMFILAHSHLL